MDKKTQIYNISRQKQLIDLNGDTVNFETNFRVVSENNQPFEAVVVDQTTLDNSPELKYQPAPKGEIAGSLRQDKNVYQNYFLVLRSENPCRCQVTIDKKEIPGIPIAPPALPAKDSATPGKKSETNWVKIGVIIVVVVILAGAGYWFWKKSQTKEIKPEGKHPFSFHGGLNKPAPPASRYRHRMFSPDKSPKLYSPYRESPPMGSPAPRFGASRFRPPKPLGGGLGGGTRPAATTGMAGIMSSQKPGNPLLDKLKNLNL